MGSARTGDESIGAALNAICPYFTMFPLSFPLTVLPSNARVVVDPFADEAQPILRREFVALARWQSIARQWLSLPRRLSFRAAP